MKNLFYVLIIVCLVASCKEIKTQKKIPEPTIAEKIAIAHGFEHWNKVNEVAFNFNGRRYWTWNPKTNAIVYTKDSITINYNRHQMDSTATQIDRAFINDKFWLLIPFQLVWDDGLEISNPVKAEALISKDSLNKITMTYSNTGGYTPGDAYDLFFDDDYLIKEWIFRKGNSKEPSLINTFENYQDFNGIKIALDHKNMEGNWNLKFSDVKINLD